MTSRFAIPAALLAASFGLAGALAQIAPADAATLTPTWSTLSPPASPPALAYATEAYDPANQTTVLFGGIGPDGAVSGATWIWNGTTWSEAPTQVSGPSPRELASMAYLPNASGGQLILFGGKAANGTPLGDTWAWNGGSWVAVGTPSSSSSAPTPRFGASMALDATGRLVLFGGTGTAVTAHAPNAADPNTRPSSTSAALHTDSVETTSAAGSSAGVNSVGSLSPSSTSANTTPPTTTPAAPATTAPASTVPPSSAASGITEAPLSGGATTTLNDTWVWNGSAWSQPNITAAPPPRTDASLVWDQAIGQTVLFGGSATPVVGGAGSPLADTWVWSGSAWIGLNPAASPPARYDASGGSAGALGGDLLADGNSGSGPLGDLWSFNGSGWTQLSPTSSIPARLGAAAAGNPAASQLMLFGGSAAAGNFDTTSVLTAAPPVEVTPAPSSTVPTTSTSAPTTAPSTTPSSTPTSAGHPSTAPASIPSRHEGVPAPTTGAGTGSAGTHPSTAPATSKTPRTSKSPSKPSSRATVPPTAPKASTATPKPTTTEPTTPPLTVSPKGPAARITSPGSGRSLPVAAAPVPSPPVVGSNAPSGAGEQHVHTGSLVTVVGSGFRPGSLVTITFHSKPFTVGRTHATAAGTFSATVTVPTGASPGQHHLEAAGMGLHGQLTVLLTPLFVMGPITNPSAPMSSTTTIVMVAVSIALPIGAWMVLWGWGKRGKGRIATR